MPLAHGIPQCHHVRTNGVRCGSPAMRGRSLCFFHTRVTAKPQARPTGMPSLEDGNAIQLGIANVIRRVLMCDIEYKAAYCLLYGYKLALFNLKNMRTDPDYQAVVTVDPTSDPENAGAVTEPLTYKQLEHFEEELAEAASQPAVVNGNDSLSKVDGDGEDNGAIKNGAINDGAINDLSSRAKPRAGVPDSSRWRGGSDLALDSDFDSGFESVRRHYLPQTPLACPERLSKSEGAEWVSPGERTITPVPQGRHTTERTNVPSNASSSHPR